MQTSGQKTALRWDPLVLLDQLPAGLMVCDRDGEILYRNQHAAGLVAEGDNLQQALAGLRPDAGGNWRINITQVLSARSMVQWTATYLSQPRRRLLIRCLPLPLSAGRPAVLLFLEGRSIETEDGDEDQSRRLVSLGKLAARVAHELNNPLDGILRFVNLALRIIPAEADPRLQNYLTESRTGLQRMIRIIGDLLEYSRLGEGAFEESTVDQVIEQVLRENSPAAEASRVVVTADFQCDTLPPVRGARLHQVLRNLVQNAVDAMPEGGRLSVSCGLIQECVVIRVSDTGVGLPDPVEKVFEPFYTTKPPGKGTGLGLAICRELIEDMGGSITAAGGDRGGALFTVRVPLSGLQGPRTLTR